MIIKGYATTIHENKNNRIIAPASWEKALERYLPTPLVFLDHYDRAVGRITQAKASAYGLEVEALIWTKGFEGLKIRDKILKENYRYFSIGYTLFDYLPAYGKHIIDDLQIYEISITNNPSNENCKFVIKEDEYIPKIKSLHTNY